MYLQFSLIQSNLSSHQTADFKSYTDKRSADILIYIDNTNS